MTDVLIPEPGATLKCNPGVKCGPHICGENIGGDNWGVFGLDLDGGSSLLSLGINLLADSGLLTLDAAAATIKLDQRLILVVTEQTGVLELDGFVVVVNPVLMPDICTDLDLVAVVCATVDLAVSACTTVDLDPEECIAA